MSAKITHEEMQLTSSMKRLEVGDKAETRSKAAAAAVAAAVFDLKGSKAVEVKSFHRFACFEATVLSVKSSASPSSGRA